MNQKQVRCQPGRKVGYREITKNARFYCWAKKQPRRDRKVRTPFRVNTKENGTERITEAELRERTRCFRCQQLGHMARVSKPSIKGSTSVRSQSFFLPGDAYAQ